MSRKTTKKSVKNGSPENLGWVDRNFVGEALGSEMKPAYGSMSSNPSGEGEIRKAVIEADFAGCMVACPFRRNPFRFWVGNTRSNSLLRFGGPEPRKGRNDVRKSVIHGAWIHARSGGR